MNSFKTLYYFCRIIIKEEHKNHYCNAIEGHTTTSHTVTLEPRAVHRVVLPLDVLELRGMLIAAQTAIRAARVVNAMILILLVVAEGSVTVEEVTSLAEVAGFYS